MFVLVSSAVAFTAAPIKVLGKKIFREYFTDFVFTNYEEGIRETIKYYKKLI